MPLGVRGGPLRPVATGLDSIVGRHTRGAWIETMTAGPYRRVEKLVAHAGRD